MKTLTILILLFVSTNILFGQLAIINDKDGYVNIREDKSVDSKLVGRVFEGDFFLVTTDSESDEWWGIFYLSKISELEKFKQEYYIKNNLTGGKEIYIQGYIHKSRFNLIDNLKSISSGNKTVRTQDLLVISDDSIKLEFKTAKFDVSRHVISRDKNGFITTIDNIVPHGVDGVMPKTEIEYVSLTINNKTTKFPTTEFGDLFEPNIELVNLCFDSVGNLILSMPYNSDGAGGYFAAWYIKNGEVTRRYIDSL